MASKSWNISSPHYTYEVWHHFNKDNKREHKRLYRELPNKEACKERIKRIKRLPIEYSRSVFNLNDTSRFTIRKHRTYFIMCRWSLKEPIVPVFFLKYKDGCNWIKFHYKNVFISDTGDYKDYLLELTKNWAKEAGNVNK